MRHSTWLDSEVWLYLQLRLHAPDLPCPQQTCFLQNSSKTHCVAYSRQQWEDWIAARPTNDTYCKSVLPNLGCRKECGPAIVTRAPVIFVSIQCTSLEQVQRSMYDIRCLEAKLEGRKGQQNTDCETISLRGWTPAGQRPLLAAVPIHVRHPDQPLDCYDTIQLSALKTSAWPDYNQSPMITSRRRKPLNYNWHTPTMTTLPNWRNEKEKGQRARGKARHGQISKWSRLLHNNHPETLSVVLQWLLSNSSNSDKSCARGAEPYLKLLPRKLCQNHILWTNQKRWWLMRRGTWHNVMGQHILSVANRDWQSETSSSVEW